AGWMLGTRQLQGFIKDVMTEVNLHARGLADWLGMLAQLEHAINVWKATAASIAPGTRLRWLGRAPESVPEAAWTRGLHGVGETLRSLLLAMGQVAETARALMPLYERGARLLSQLASFAQPVPDDSVRWLEVQRQHVRLIESPLSIARLMREHMEVGEDIEGHGDGIVASAPADKAWIFTSATLGDDDDLRW